MLSEMTLATKVRGEGARERFRYRVPLCFPLSLSIALLCAALSFFTALGLSCLLNFKVDFPSAFSQPASIGSVSLVGLLLVICRIHSSRIVTCICTVVSPRLSLALFFYPSCKIAAEHSSSKEWPPSTGKRLLMTQGTRLRVQKIVLVDVACSSWPH